MFTFLKVMSKGQSHLTHAHCYSVSVSCAAARDGKRTRIDMQVQV